MDDAPEFFESDLSRTVTVDGLELRIAIYGSPSEGWILEVRDPDNTSCVWDEKFPTEQLALDAFDETIEEEGLEWLVDPEPAEPQARLTQVEEHLLYHRLLRHTGHGRHWVQGALTAASVHPSIHFGPSSWLPVVIGSSPLSDEAEVERVVGRLFRAYNSVNGLLDDGIALVPDSSKWDLLCSWCSGFVSCLEADVAWKYDPTFMDIVAPVLAVARSTRPNPSAEVLTEVRRIREWATTAVEHTVIDLHGYGQDIREAQAEWLDKQPGGPKTSPRAERRIGRNQPCPCGSGKKYKRCCGR